MEINDTGYKAMMKYYAARLKPHMSELAKMVDKDMTAIIENDIKKRAINKGLICYGEQKD